MKNINTKEIWNIGFRLLTAVVIVGLFIYISWPILTPVLIAAIFALAMNPFVSLLQRRLKRSRRLCAIILLLGFSFLFLLPGVNFLYRSTRLIQNTNFQESPLQKQLERLEGYAESQMQKLSDKTGLDLTISKDSFRDSISKISNSLMQSAVNIFAELPSVILGVFLILVSMYFFMVEASYFREMLFRFSFLEAEQTKEFLDLIKDSCRAILLSNVVVGAVQAAIVGLGALICGYNEFMIIAFLTFVVSFIPVIGAGPVALVLSAASFLESDIASGIGLLVTALVAGTIDNILRPFLISGKIEMHPLLGLLSVIGGVLVFGIAGLFFGPLIAILAIQGLPLLLQDKS